MAACKAAICIIYTTGSSFCKGLNHDRDNTQENKYYGGEPDRALRRDNSCAFSTRSCSRCVCEVVSRTTDWTNRFPMRESVTAFTSTETTVPSILRSSPDLTDGRPSLTSARISRGRAGSTKNSNRFLCRRSYFVAPVRRTACSFANTISPFSARTKMDSEAFSTSVRYRSSEAL